MCHPRNTLYAILCLLTVTATATRADSIVVFWNETALRAVRNGTLGPPMVSRGLAMVHTATYDAWAAYDGTAVGTRHGGDLRRPAGERTLANKEKAVSYAAFRTLMNIYPAQSNLFLNSMSALGFDPNDASVDTSTPQGIGNVVSSAIIGYRQDDGANQRGNTLDPNSNVVAAAYGDYTGYQPVNTTNLINDPNRWQPLLFSNGASPRAMAPHWKNVTPFALTNPAQFRPPAPYRFVDGNRAASRRYVSQTRQIVNLTAKLTDKQKMIVEYWADGPRSETPPGHWNLFAQFISLRDGHTVDEDAKMFFALNNANMDSAIAVWEAKFFYDNQRPITAIHFLYSGQQVPTWRDTNGLARTILGDNWVPFQPNTFISPPFPDYVSGHSTFSAAAAEVLKSFTGSDELRARVTLAARSSKADGAQWPLNPVTLSWTTFSVAAKQAGLSRRLGGIHFLQADLEAQKLGKKIGRLVWSKSQTYFDGTAPTP